MGENRRVRATGSRAEDRRASGGDPACWLNRVCTECGLFLEDTAAAACPRCGTVIDLG